MLSDIWESIKDKLQLEHKRFEIPAVWFGKKKISFDEYFVGLKIKSSKAEETRDIRVDEVFKRGEGKTPSRILIEGPAGFGKSTLAQKFCFDHANGETYLEQFDVIIFLHLKEMQTTLDEMIIKTLHSEKCYKAEHILDALEQNQSRVLFILDDVDELYNNQRHNNHIIALLKGKRFTDATVIATASTLLRSCNNEHLTASLQQYIDSTLLITGIIGQNVEMFIQAHFSDYSPDELNSYIKLADTNFGLKFEEDEENFIGCPLLLRLLLTSVKEMDRRILLKPRTKTELYKTLFNFLLRQMLLEEVDSDGIDNYMPPSLFNFDNENPPAYVHMLSRFGSFAMKEVVKTVPQFAAQEIAQYCGDETILWLGIFTQKQLRSSPTQCSQQLLEPIHRSLLAFCIAYHIWSTVMSSSELESFFKLTGIMNIVAVCGNNNLTLPFLFGLCGEKLHTICSLLAHHSYCHLWLEAFTASTDSRQLQAESNMTQCELAKTFLPLIPTKMATPKKEVLCTNLLKETLIHATNMRRLKHLSFEQQCTTSRHEHTSSPINVFLERNSYFKPLQDWYDIISHQDIFINEYSHETVYKFLFTMCDAPIDHQLQWMLPWMMFEGVFELDKPLRTVHFWCLEGNLMDALNLITDLIRKERVQKVGLFLEADVLSFNEQWCELLRCAKQSNTLLDMVVSVKGLETLFVDLVGSCGKRWRRIELEGSVVTVSGPHFRQYYLSCQQPGRDIMDFIEDLPSTVQYLSVRPCSSLTTAKYLFIQTDILSSSASHNLRELFITFDKSSLALRWPHNWADLRNLRVLAIAFSRDLDDKETEFVLPVLSIVSDCRLPLRLELWFGCTEEFIRNLLQGLCRKGKVPLLESQRQSGSLISAVKSGCCTLDTLMLSHEIDFGEEDLPQSQTMELMKEVLVCGHLNNFWVTRDTRCYGYATPQFIDSLTSDKRFTCELGDENEQQASMVGDSIVSVLKHFKVTVIKIHTS